MENIVNNMGNKMDDYHDDYHHYNTALVIVIILILLVAAVLWLIFFDPLGLKLNNNVNNANSNTNTGQNGDNNGGGADSGIAATNLAGDLGDMKKFESEEDFKNYLAKAELKTSRYGEFWSGNLMIDRGFEESLNLISESSPGMVSDFKLGSTPEPSRYSQTNVQVSGIDEPDIVKTDGKEIYFSKEGYYYQTWREPFIEDQVGTRPSYPTNGTMLINAFPPASLAKDSNIEQYGNLLLKDNILMVFTYNEIYAYDVKDLKNPSEKWKIELENNNNLVSARLYGDKIYLLTNTYIQQGRPCPIEPFLVNGETFNIKCADIYHPTLVIPTETTYHASVVNINSGKIDKNISFIGSTSSSQFYMSENNMYVAYFYNGDEVKFLYNFFDQKARDIIPDWVMEKLSKLMDYDISDQSKETEINMIINKLFESMSDDDRLKFENEMTNRMSNYYKEHGRELERTGIYKINVQDLSIKANGNVPGVLLNQFSLDEYQDKLRVATTIGKMRSFDIFSGVRQSVSDVYILDDDLKIIGSVTDLGKTEQIYSVRFIEDKGYVVTFRQTDPFYVLDLSDSKNPQLRGELKIPGYSSYLHPIDKDKILGIGEESGRVKISLFDVSSPDNPVEKSKYNLDDYWSEISSTHHAFLIDKKHNVFFLPGSKGGYIFSYDNDSLSLKKAVSNIAAKRAVYINDYLYIIGQDKLIVLSEFDWEQVNKLEFSQ